MNENETCHNCAYEWDSEALDTNGYCPNCASAYESGHTVGFMNALQTLAGIDTDKFLLLIGKTGNERYTLLSKYAYKATE